MAALAQIITFVACASLVDCRFLSRFHKHLIDHHQAPAKTNVDADAVIFPDDSQYDDSKNIEDNAMTQTTHENDEDIQAKDKHIMTDAMPLMISKIIPTAQVKDVFTNPVSEKTEIVTDKIISDKTTVNKKPDETVEINEADKNLIATHDNYVDSEVAIAANKGVAIDAVANLNSTAPDFPSRFGDGGNYMLVPVAGDVQNFQQIQTNPNIMPISNGQGAQSYLPTNGANANQQLSNTPNVQNIDIGTPNFTPNNDAPNIGTGIAEHVAVNIGLVQYPVSDKNYIVPQANSNTYVNIPNTYVINGQLYAAVTVPDHANVPNILHYIIPQLAGYQLLNLPLYKLVSLNGGNQVIQNTQFVQSK